MHKLATLTCVLLAVVIAPCIAQADTIQHFPMDTDPGWSTQGAWSFGQPLGGGSYNMDPTSGYTGSSVYGYNLSGDYPDYLPQYWLTTTAIDCSAHQNVVLRFYRWLGVESAYYDHASIEVSNDGTLWSTVWTNGIANISDTTWQEVSYDISAIADGQGTVFVRWGMGPTDFLVTYPGWNIDDVSFEGDPADDLGISPSDGFNSTGYVSGPFSPTQTVYVLTNKSTSTSINWTIDHSESWLTVAPASGSLPPSGTSDITVSINAEAVSLPDGVFADTLGISNQTSSAVQLREVSLEILPRPGEIAVADTIPPTNDLDMAYGDIIVGLSRTEQVTVSNIEGSNDLVITEISLRAGSITTNSAADGPSAILNRANNNGRQRRSKPESSISAGGLDVLMLASSTEPSILRSALSAFPDIDSVDYFDGYTGTPTPALLSGYDALVVLNNEVFQDASAVGDLLADYVDSGKVVVQAESTFSSDLGLTVGGRFASEGYSPFTLGSLFFDFFPWYLGAYDADHPIMEGVTALSDYLICDVGLRTGSEWVADWNDGTPLVAVSDRGVVGINIYAMDDGLYGGDVAQLFRNAIMNVATAGFELGDIPALPHAVAPGSNLVLDITYAPTHTGSNSASLVIASNDADEPEVVVALSGAGILDYLAVTPEQGLFTSGHPGGPYSPASIQYELQNIGTVPVNWQAFTGETWVSVMPASGILSTGATTTVTVGLSAAAEALGEGSYTDTVIISNTTTGIAQTRDVLLDVFTSSQIIVIPTNGFVVTNQPGQLQSRTLVVSNSLAADGNLDFSVSAVETGRNEAAGQTPIEATTLSGESFSATIDTNAPHKPGRMLVRFAPGLDAAAQHAKVSAVDGTIRKRFSLVPGLCVVELDKGRKVRHALQAMKQTAGVRYAQPDYIWHAGNLPDDTHFSTLWGMNNTGQSGGAADADIDAPEAWNSAIGNHSIVVAVIDTGVDYTHPDLNDNMWRNPGEIPGNGLDDDSNGYVDDVYGYDFVNDDGDPMDDHYHGTHCAGTVGAEGDNGEGVVGVCWDVSIMALKFLDSAGYGSTVDAISCVEYARMNGARLTSNSWSGGPYDQALKDAIEAAGNLGITFVAAAGNDNSDNDSTPAYPSSFDSDCIIAVVSSDHNDNRSSFSNYGLTTTDLAAPGSSIYSCEPGGSYQYLSGTSMATPHVAGACALLLTVNPYLSPSDMRQLLIDTVDPTLPGVCVSGGRMNLAQATTEATASWMLVAPSLTNDVVPGASVGVSVEFDATGLSPGSYTGMVVVACNDPDTPFITMPTTMIVAETDPLDLDGDGIPDWWETQYFGGPSNCIWNAVCANGINTMLEAYVAGLDPTDPDSVFRIIDHTPLEDGFVIYWQSVSGRVYTALWQDSLTNEYQILESNMPYPRNSSTDTIHSVEENGFYRLEVDLQ